jgi:Calcineurin-like phosphoesterase
MYHRSWTTFISSSQLDGSSSADDRVNDSASATGYPFLLRALTHSSGKWTSRLRWRPSRGGRYDLGSSSCVPPCHVPLQSWHFSRYHPIIASFAGTRNWVSKTGQERELLVHRCRGHRPASADLPLPPTPGQIFAAARTLKPAFIVWTGDAIFGLDDARPDVIRKQYQAFFKLARQAGVPVFMAPGNHEMDVKIPVPGSSAIREIGSAQMQALYRRNMELASDAPLYGAFTYGNSRFILLNRKKFLLPKLSARHMQRLAQGAK